MHLCSRIEMTCLLARSGTKKRFGLFNLSAMLMGISTASEEAGSSSKNINSQGANLALSFRVQVLESKFVPFSGR